MKKVLLIAILAAGAVISTYSLQATSDQGDDTEHVSIGWRRVSEERYQAFLKEREEKAKETEETAVPRAYYPTTHEGAYHAPVIVSPLGENVELEDHSIWEVYQKDRKKTLDWMSGDRVIVVPNSAWFSSHLFRFINLNTKAEAQVNLTVGPMRGGSYTRHILAIDYENRQVCLNDGSVWKVSRLDKSALQEWLVDDVVIIGINNGWFSSMNPNILINVTVETLDYVRGKVVRF